MNSLLILSLIPYFLLAGQNATLSCQVGSSPMARVRWFYQDLQQRREILNNSASHRGEQVGALPNTYGEDLSKMHLVWFIREDGKF